MCACVFFLLNTWIKLDQTLRKSSMDEGDVFFSVFFSDVPSPGSICGDQFLCVSLLWGIFGSLLLGWVTFSSYAW